MNMVPYTLGDSATDNGTDATQNVMVLDEDAGGKESTFEANITET